MTRLALIAVALTACAPERPGASSMPRRDTCSTARLGNLVGQEATPRLIDFARRRAGAKVVRILRPGEMVSMLYMFGRLDIRVDAANRVLAFSCG